MRNAQIIQELTRACFGLTFGELSYLIEFYAEKIGTYNDYVQFPRITRSKVPAKNIGFFIKNVIFQTSFVTNVLKRSGLLVLSSGPRD